MWWLWLASVAHAGDLTWRWGEEPVRFHAEALVTTHLGTQYLALVNLDARAVQTVIALDLTCRREPGGSAKVVELGCAIDHASVEGKAWRGEQDKLDRIFAEYGELLTGATIQIEARADGHIRTVDLEGVSKDQQRWAIVHEQLRQLLRKVLAPLSVQMPKHGEDPGKPWKHRGTPLAFEVGSNFGTAGGLVYRYEVAGREGDDVHIVASGRGNVSTGAELDSSGTLGLNLVVTGQLRWDAADGMIAYSEVAVNGTATASAVAVGPQQRYALAAWIARVNDDGTLEALQAGEPIPRPEIDPAVERVPTTRPAAPDVEIAPPDAGEAEPPPQPAPAPTPAPPQPIPGG